MNRPTQRRAQAGFFTLMVVALAGCAVEPEAIRFGEEQCNFCRMTIVDRKHASQWVTSKGKQHKFDAIECLVNALDQPDSSEDLAILLVADYGTGEMTEAETATYLISEAIRSPMGESLSAFSTRESALALQSAHGGDLFTWSELRAKFNRQP